MRRPAQPPPRPDWLSPVAAGRRILFNPEDSSVLSETLCILRAQIEVFEATNDDIKVRAERGGIKKEFLTVGRVGIRCIHCSHLPLEARARGAVSYPNSIRIVYQAVRNFQRYHFLACDQTPAQIKDMFRTCRGRGSHSKKDSQEYWIACCEEMGMVDTGADSGIRLRGAASEVATANTEARSNLQQGEQSNFSPETHEGRADYASSAPLTMEMMAEAASNNSTTAEPTSREGADRVNQLELVRNAISRYNRDTMREQGDTSVARSTSSPF